MANSKTINVELGPQQAILQRQLESGLYDNASEVLRDALQLMESRDAVFDEWLRSEVHASLSDKRPSVPIDEAFKRARAAVGRKGKAAKRDA